MRAPKGAWFCSAAWPVFTPALKTRFGGSSLRISPRAKFFRHVQCPRISKGGLVDEIVRVHL